jgi:hypothetical protein
MTNQKDFPEFHLRKPMTCPWCGAVHDGVMALTDHDKPRAGDIFVCIGCGRVNVVLGANQLRKPTWEEMREYLTTMPELVIALATWKLAFGDKK